MDENFKWLLVLCVRACVFTFVNVGQGMDCFHFEEHAQRHESVCNSYLLPSPPSTQSPWFTCTAACHIVACLQCYLFEHLILGTRSFVVVIKPSGADVFEIYAVGWNITREILLPVCIMLLHEKFFFFFPPVTLPKLTRRHTPPGAPVHSLLLLRSWRRSNKSKKLVAPPNPFFTEIDR